MRFDSPDARSPWQSARRRRVRKLDPPANLADLRRDRVCAPRRVHKLNRPGNRPNPRTRPNLRTLRPQQRSSAACSTSSGSSVMRRRPGTVVSTSTSGSSHVGIRTRCGRQRSPPPGSSSAGAPSSSRRRGGRRSAVAASSSTTTRTRRTRPSSAHGRYVPARRAGVGASDLGRDQHASPGRADHQERARAAGGGG